MSLLVGPLVAAADAYEIFRASEVHDKPDIPVISRDNFVARLAHPWPGSDHEHYLAYVDGMPVGYVDMELPYLDNLGNVQIQLSVLPGYRRRGVGRALVDMVVERARAAGRKTVIGHVMSRHPDGALFAAAMDAKPGLEEVRSRLDLRTLDQARIDGLYADAWRHATGYRLTQWTGVPPAEIVEDVAYLDSRLNVDAPVGDPSWEPAKADAEKIREGELRAARRGRISYHAGALLGARLVAWTKIAGDLVGEAHAWQNITLVAPEHRGRRLGTLVKIANLAHVRALRPSLQRIDTCNAASNEHMLRINRAMGFRPIDSLTYWQMTL
ncbi:GNAT family N-acetyltransferase [Actinoplanes sp. KI2]|uniref:GNAT family N-acetyltransferase n=1 Tax=Actinoplanes sp. KI2 TaxID=2983315 RepID=UPI0021D5F942|nr:GNAT family N-acetyltransferase [Actinoplanes sp. KI2]MCU7727200.1 GNAT family N-acetyltransferase [Actinoplanes sp. KI2]